MKYTKEERLAIAEEVISQHKTLRETAEKYSVSFGCVESWVKKYRELNGIIINKPKSSPDFEELNSLSKDELINEVIKARIGEERAKKGYEVKGGGQKKEYVSLSNKSIK